MDYKSTLGEIKDFLDSYESIWNKEIIYNYPKTLSAYDNQHLELLNQLTDDELWKIDARFDFSPIKGTPLLSLIEKTMSFNQIINQYTPTRLNLPLLAFTRIKDKKHHELDNLIPLIIDLKHKLSFQTVIDIGGGVGHLSRILGSYFSTEATCIDINQEFLTQGEINYKRLHPKHIANVKFHNMDIKKTPLENFNHTMNLFNANAFVVGLHSCGQLSSKLLQAAVHYQVRGILNFGCCYFKYDHSRYEHLSMHAKSNPLFINEQGLTLATRAHTFISKQDFHNKFQVKSFRFGLHLLLYELLEQKQFITMGDSPIKDYFNGFSSYVLKKLEERHIKHTLTAKVIDNYFSEQDIQKKIRKMFLCNLIRWFFGRPLELYILLDRAVYMQEHGYHTTLTQYFDEKISPRNVGILGTF